MTEASSMYRRMDDIMGPITEGTDEVLYLFMTEWTTQSDAVAQSVTYTNTGTAGNTYTDGTTSLGNVRKYKITTDWH